MTIILNNIYLFMQFKELYVILTEMHFNIIILQIWNIHHSSQDQCMHMFFI